MVQRYDGFRSLSKLFLQKHWTKPPPLDKGQRPDSCPKEDVCKRKTIPENPENFWLSSHLFVTLHPESVHYGVINRESGVNPEQSRCCKPSLSEQTQSH